MRSELKSGKWLAGAICLQLAVGYTVGFLVFQIGTLITTGTLGAGFLPGLIAVLCFAAVIVYLIRRTNRDWLRNMPWVRLSKGIQKRRCFV